LNRYEPGVARAADGSKSAADRAALLADFRAGAFRVLVNCALFTEGFDEPSIACAAIARPTKSRALYTQMVGRGTRLAEGKADCLVLDFTGQAGRHRLVGPADVLAGRELDDDVRSEIERLLGGDAQPELDAVLEATEADIAARREAVAVRAIARYRAEEVDPFVGDLPPAPDAPWASDLASDKQREALHRAGLENLPAALTKGEAGRWLDAIAKRREAGLATVKQVRKLRRYDIDARAMTFQEASERLGQIAAEGWIRRVRCA
jgi:type I site-specific restriction endonuclease